MGNTLGCVKQPKEQAGEVGHPPLSPKRKARFKRKRRGKKRTATAEGAADLVAKEPSKGIEIAEEGEALTKLGAVPSQVQGEDLIESLHQSTVVHEKTPPALQPRGVEQGHVVQVRERFQGKLEKIHLVPEHPPSGSGTLGDHLEEGTTVVARLLDNPAEQNRKKATSRLVAFQRPGAGNSRAILVPLQREPSAAEAQGNDEGTVVVCRSWEQSGLEAAATVTKESRVAYTSDDGNESLSSATWGTSWTAEKGTVSELSTPSPMVDQVENQALGKPQQPPSSQEGPFGKGGEGTWANLHASQSKSSFSESTSSAFRCSSGYGSDSTHPLAKASGMDKNSMKISEDGPASFEGTEGPKGRLRKEKSKPPAEGGLCRDDPQ
ncbi:UNVERIFIED_CONTAM: hypothetical protein K2H54_044022 [Gekko kuhli]